MMLMFRGQFDTTRQDQLFTRARVAAGREAEASPGSVHAFLGYLYWWTGHWDLARVNFRLAVQSTRTWVLSSVAAVVILDGAGRSDFTQTDRQLRHLESEPTETPWPEAIAQLHEVAVIRLHAQAGTESARAELLPAYRARWPQSPRPWPAIGQGSADGDAGAGRNMGRRTGAGRILAADHRYRACGA
jgi:hypothetical protein